MQIHARPRPSGFFAHPRPIRPSIRFSKATAFEIGYDPDVIIVGGGLAGISCAKHCLDRSLSVALFESTNRLGGRVKTDNVNGFLLDHGFQIFLTAYPEAQRCLDYDALRLKPFYNGAMVWYDGNFYRVADPFRHPIAGVASLLNPIGSFQDKARVGLLRLSLSGRSIDEILKAPETTTLERLKELQFSEAMTDRFFRPFFGGIFFDDDLQVSSRLFEFVMKILSTGENTLPENGIGVIVSHLAEKIPPFCFHLNQKVENVRPAADIHVLPSITLQGTETSIFAKKAVVIATNQPSLLNLLDASYWPSDLSKDVQGVGTCCLYFSAFKAPLNGENVLYLNGERDGIVNNCCFPSTVSASYAPPGETLVSVSTVGSFPEMSDDALESEVRKQMGKWFGPFDVSSWKLLKIYRIPFAQPIQTPPSNFEKSVRLGNKVYICGDHRDTATFEGAIKSGRRAAEAIFKDVS